MNFQKLIDNLRKNHEISLLSAAYDHEIQDVRLLDPRTEQTSPDTLYFGYDIQIPAFPMHCILVSEDPSLGGARIPGDTNLARISPAEFSAVFNEVQDLIHSSRQSSFYRYLMDVADRVHSVDTLIDVASQSFGASLILIDRNFRILSSSTQVPVTDHLWVENIRKGYCDYEFITEVRKLKSVQMADSSSNPIEVTCKSSPFRKLASRVICRDTWIGSLILIEGDDSYRPAHPEMLRTLSGVVGYAILKFAPEFLYRMNEYHDFLNNLLIGAPFESQPEAWRKLPFPDPMQVIFFEATKNPALFPGESSLASRLKRILPNAHLIATRSHATLIGSAEDLADPNPLFSLFPEENAVQAGASHLFSGIRHLRAARKEAADALETGRLLDPDRRLFPFEEYGLYVMLRKVKDGEDIRRYLHPSIRMLQAYDYENSSHLLETLRVYLEKNANIKDTAEALFLHRNSVTYRLHKIEELTGLTLEDGDTAFRLRLSFTILKV